MTQPTDMADQGQLELQVVRGGERDQHRPKDVTENGCCAIIEDHEIDRYCREVPPNEDTVCGLWIFKGEWMQSLANKKVLVLLLGLSGCIFSSTHSYFNGTITTMEKRFRISSKTMGIISVGNDITQLFASVILNYYASKGHQPRWIAFGLSCVVIFCFLNVLPHILYGPGEEALQLTFEYGADFNIVEYSDNSTETQKSDQLCSVKENQTCISGEGNAVTVVILFVSQLILGIGGILFYSLGYSYLDDNIKKSKSPVFISFTYFMRMLGPALGFAIVSICVKFYIAPTLTPSIDNLDPRWLGAWWLGWIILGIAIAILATLMALLPKTLPRAAARKELLRQRSSPDERPEITKASMADMIKTCKRLFVNKIYVYTQLSNVFYIFGYIPFWIFLPKYIETVYRKSASIASLVTGTVGLGFAAIGILVAGLVVQKFRPRARYMAWWNMFIGVVSTLGIFSYSFLGCPAVDELLPLYDDREFNSTLSCNVDCMCEFVKFSPVCSMDKNQTFISACHAGCTTKNTLESGTIVYSNCSCISQVNLSSVNPGIEEELHTTLIGGAALSGPCPVDCQYQFYMFVAIICLLKFIGSLSRVTNFLVSIRCVEERDKTVSLGISISACSLFALIPSPIFFGHLFDSTCIVWGQTCAGTGNCWLFDSALMRSRIIYISCVFLFIGVFYDAAVWLNMKNINIFDDALFEDFDIKKTKKRKSQSERDPYERRDSEVSHLMIAYPQI